MKEYNCQEEKTHMILDSCLDQIPDWDHSSLYSRGSWVQTRHNSFTTLRMQRSSVEKSILGVWRKQSCPKEGHQIHAWGSSVVPELRAGMQCTSQERLHKDYLRIAVLGLKARKVYQRSLSIGIGQHSVSARIGRFFWTWKTKV